MYAEEKDVYIDGDNRKIWVQSQLNLTSDQLNDLENGKTLEFTIKYKSSSKEDTFYCVAVKKEDTNANI